ncbi:MAG: glycosyltransferase family 39 protein [Candidatus Babeliales bacterium]
MMQVSHKNIYIFCIIFYVFASFFLYFIAANNYDAHLDLDSPGYIRVAQQFAQSNILIDPARGNIIPVQTVGYPLFLGVIYKLFGQNFSFIIILQVLLSMGIAWLLYSIAFMLFNAEVALITVILWAINLGYLVFSQFILTDILLAILIIAGLQRFLSFLLFSTKKALIQSAIIFGISLIVKPVALFYVFILYFFLLWKYKKNIVYGLKIVCLFAICFYSFAGSYMIYNKSMFGAFTIAPVMNENIYYYFLARITARVENISYPQAIKKTAQLFEGKDHNDVFRWQLAREKLFNYFFQKPTLVIGIWLNNMLKTLGGFYTSQLKFLVNPALKGISTSFFEKNGSWYDCIKAYIFDGTNNHLVQSISFLYLICVFFQFFLIMSTLCICLVQGRFFLASFFGLTILYFAFITGHDGCARYRIMFEGLYLLLAALGIWLLWEYIQHRKIRIPSQLS